MYTKAAAGIGSLIMFGLVVLAFAFGAGLLLQSGSQLQAKSFITGSQVQVSEDSSIIFTDVTLVDKKTLLVSMRVSPGSLDVSLRDIELELVLDNISASYRFSNSASVTSFSPITAISSISQEPVQVEFISPRDFESEENFRIISDSEKIGSSQIFGKTPDQLSSGSIQLFP